MTFQLNAGSDLIFLAGVGRVDFGKGERTSLPIMSPRTATYTVPSWTRQMPSMPNTKVALAAHLAKKKLLIFLT